MSGSYRESDPIIANVSNRHWHCTKETFEKLFGEGATPTVLRELIQPGQFACKETITVKGIKGEIKNVRMIGPFRKYDQVEVSRTDAFQLGIRPPVRDSGNLKESAPVTLIGPKGEVQLKEGAIVAARHIHFHTAEAEKFGVKNLEYVKIKIGVFPRDAILTILCRVKDDMKLECHLDTDEANAFDVKNGDHVVIVRD